ncbi:MAG: AMP-binding protein, partial [Paracoccaceae bacterium]
MSAEANAATWFVDRHPREGRADKTAFREAGGGRSLTYGALADGAGRVAGAMGRAGHRREERAAMIVLDTVEFPQVFWGCIKAGIVPIPLNTLLSADIYNVILRDCRASCLFV